MEQNNIAKTHKLALDNRKQMSLTGIKDVVAFDLNQVLLESTLGMIHIKGNDLKVTKLSIEKGEVNVGGNIDSIVYSDVKAYGEKGKSFVKRMFR
ncbi:MAG: sporulation protein YabP [Eubacterium sp.]|nr:sporulation protein YabP [Eubacterium sp.]